MKKLKIYIDTSVRGLSNIKGYGNIDIVQPTILIQNGDKSDDN